MEEFKHPYRINPDYDKAVAYFCMEYAIDQSLKIYAGGLGYLAGSHMRSAYTLRQNLIGIGILWKYGYYDQVRQQDGTMGVLFQEKQYSFLKETDIKFVVTVHNHDVWVKAYYLEPQVFETAPIFLLSTDLPENDYLARTITHRLYDSNVSTKIAQYIVLGVGGVKLLETLHRETDVFHFNEAHALPGAYALLEKYGSLQELRKRMVFTTHTPVPSGNEIHDVQLLNSMSYFDGLPFEKVKRNCLLDGQSYNQTLNALHLAGIANGVSKMHGEVARKMWEDAGDICDIGSVTNAQNAKYWQDSRLAAALQASDETRLVNRKKVMKQALFEVVADQGGKHFSPDVLTIVWCRRFAEYKRADLITKDMERFEKLMKNTEHPVQLIWAGKPYPQDQGAIDVFNRLVYLSKGYDNCVVLTGYELKLSGLLKGGADIWLNTPRITREASGTSGMTAAMNGAINFSTADGWIPEFAVHGINTFIIAAVNAELPNHQQDWLDLNSMYRILEKEILPMYYNEPERWTAMVKKSMSDILPYFDSDRMADEYYRTLYNYVHKIAAKQVPTLAETE
ncbi:MAG TPA: alpha-glucan family phosphorylase [Saprospiraceae bacterium]|nr:alpha-glucan family phosphorylase [Saprospiraceae bacterium]